MSKDKEKKDLKKRLVWTISGFVGGIIVVVALLCLMKQLLPSWLSVIGATLLGGLTVGIIVYFSLEEAQHASKLLELIRVLSPYIFPLLILLVLAGLIAYSRKFPPGDLIKVNINECYERKGEVIRKFPATWTFPVEVYCPMDICKSACEREDP